MIGDSFSRSQEKHDSPSSTAVSLCVYPEAHGWKENVLTAKKNTRLSHNVVIIDVHTDTHHGETLVLRAGRCYYQKSNRPLDKVEEEEDEGGWLWQEGHIFPFNSEQISVSSKGDTHTHTLFNGMMRVHIRASHAGKLPGYLSFRHSGGVNKESERERERKKPYSWFAEICHCPAEFKDLENSNPSLPWLGGLLALTLSHKQHYWCITATETE